MEKFWGIEEFLIKATFQIGQLRSKAGQGRVTLLDNPLENHWTAHRMIGYYINKYPSRHLVVGIDVVFYVQSNGFPMDYPIVSQSHQRYKITRNTGYFFGRLTNLSAFCSLHMHDTEKCH